MGLKVEHFGTENLKTFVSLIDKAIERNMMTFDVHAKPGELTYALIALTREIFIHREKLNNFEYIVIPYNCSLEESKFGDSLTKEYDIVRLDEKESKVLEQHLKSQQVSPLQKECYFVRQDGTTGYEQHYDDVCIVYFVGQDIVHLGSC